ncbi:MAG: 4-(cytidine 5'-diphospho)-2-C-methyl-D-erythritol kinase [Sedimentisphaerales bacterium]|nr:4-(cytidine 5'-diphospho)-2-C-methyl-D-erythritol kinase [Sedimentisphaerales bacterium]
MDAALPSVGGIDCAITLAAPAKINLSLLVFSRQPDGYHDLHTVMATVDFYDDLHLCSTDSEGITLRCLGEACPDGPENLVYRAASLLAEHAGLRPRVQILLHKHIPAGAGLGGASSDAAACLWGLNRLWKLDLPRRILSQLGAQLGSDVPFFFYGPVALCTGRGQIVQPLDLRSDRFILLIMPKLSVSTAQVYQHYVYHPDQSRQRLGQVEHCLQQGDLDGLLDQPNNSLEEACYAQFASLRRLRDELEAAGIAPLGLSGSGSTLFAATDSSEQVNQWARQLHGRDEIARVRTVRFHNQGNPFTEVHHADFGNSHQTGGEPQRST